MGASVVDASIIAEMLQGGGLIAFAGLVYRELQVQGETLKTLSRVVHVLEERTRSPE